MPAARESSEPSPLARIILAASLVFFALALSWELFGPLPGGHLGNVTGASIGGENMLTHRLFAAVTSYTDAKPEAASYYCHHPYGVFVLQAIAHALFGHGFATTRLPAIALSVASVGLVSALGRRLYGALPGALGAAFFAVLPMSLAFGQFANLEVLVIFAGLVFAIGTVDVLRTGKRSALAVALLGALLVCHADFCGFVLVGAVGGLEIARVYVLGGKVPRRLVFSHARFVVLVTALSLATLLLYLALFVRAGQLGDLVRAYDNRTAGNEAVVGALLGKRRVLWLLGLLPAPALVAGGAGVILAIVKMTRRRPEHGVVLGFFVMTAVQVLLFRGGAEVHVFWPHAFVVSAALGLAAIAELVFSLPPRAPRATRAAFLVGVGLLLVVVGRMGLVQLAQSRLTGGRFDDGGRYIGIDRDLTAFGVWARGYVDAHTPPLPTRTSLPVIGLHPSVPRSWFVEYALHAIIRESPPPARATATEAARFVLFDARHATAREQRYVAQQYAVRAHGPLWLLDRAGHPGDFHALRYVEAQPRGMDFLLRTGTDLQRTFGDDRDALHEHEQREHLGLPTDLAPFEPTTAEEARLRVNLAVSRGEAPDPAHRSRALGIATVRVDRLFDNGLVLRGYDVDRGPATVVTLLWETPEGYVPRDLDYLVRARITSLPTLWLAPPDHFEKEMAPPEPLRPASWKAGRLYVQRFVAMKRVGREVFEGVFTARDGAAPIGIDGAARHVLFTLD